MNPASYWRLELFPLTPEQLGSFTRDQLMAIVKAARGN